MIERQVVRASDSGMKTHEKSSMASDGRIAVLSAVKQLMYAASDVRATYTAIVRAAMSLIGTSAGMLAVAFDEHPHSLTCGYQVVAAFGFENGPQVGETFQVGQSLPGRVVHDALPLLVDDVIGDVRFHPWYKRGRPPASALYTPLRDGGQVIGLLALAGEKRGIFSTRDLTLLNSFAELAAQSLLNAQLCEQVEQATALKERAAMTREMQETVVQDLGRILARVQALSAPAALDADVVDMPRSLHSLEASLAEIVTKAQQLCWRSKKAFPPMMMPARPRSKPEREAWLKDLTNREREILALLGQGLQDREIAERLVITRKTVSFHTTSLYRKLEVTSRLDAVRKALALGLLSPP